jgi:hypothetical protein
MDNMINIALKANASIKPIEDDSIISFNESELNTFLNLVYLETIKELDNK